MSELSGLELRKAACEVLGWTALNPSDWSPSDYESLVRDGYAVAPDGVCRVLPAIESDPAVSIPALREYCKARNYGWRIEETDIVRVFIFRRGQITRNGLLTVASEKGDDVSPCISRAIVASRKEEGV